MKYDPALLTFAFVAGGAMGAAYLAVLWAVVRRLANTNRPASLLLVSAALRVGLLLAGWYWVADGRWDGLVACLLGFICARLIATRLAATAGSERAMNP